MHSLRHSFRSSLACLLTGLLLQGTSAHAVTDLNLPSLGNTSAGLMSSTEEYDFGRKLVRKFRAGLPESSDPFVEDYLFNLVQKLVRYSDLQDPRIELLVIENPTLNAFAAPGGIIGINTGALLVAETEQQLASIVAHELAHLSQRHYARKLNETSKNNMLAMAALLAGILVAASSSDGNAIAALPATQAAAIQANLKFSREMEIEADRIGMHTLLNAGFDPYAMPNMFQVMMRSTRFRSKMPEFLLSHPVTEKRVSDSLSRASRYPKKHYPLDVDFQLARARIMIEQARNPQAAVKRFKEEVKGHALPRLTAHYGLVRSLTLAKRPEEARKALIPLKNLLAEGIALTITEADILEAEGKLDAAIQLLEQQRSDHPTHHPLNVRLAELLMKSGEYEKCESLLTAHVKRRPSNSYVWYLLAEVHGLAGHILEVHKARAEYFILLGIYPKAEIQLKNALKLIDKDDFHARARIEQRLIEVKALQEDDIS